MVAATIAMVADGNQKIARKYMQAAGIPDSTGDLGWLDASPDMLDPDELARGGFDLAVRYGILRDSSLRVRKLAQGHRLACASPEYLECRGTPRRPAELEQHNCLLMRFGDGPDNAWVFAKDGEEQRILVRGDRMSNDGELVRRWCLAGLGIALKSEADVARDLEAGRLLRVLPEYRAGAFDLQLVYPGGRALPRRVRALIDYLLDSAGPSAVVDLPAGNAAWARSMAAASCSDSRLAT